MNTLAYLLSFEGGILLLALLVFVIYEISVRHPKAFKLPTIPGIKLPETGSNNFIGKLKADLALIYKPVHPEFYISPDGNNLYLSVQYTNTWTPYQVVLYMLAQKKEFLDQIQAKDPTVFDAINELTGQLQKVPVVVSFQHMNFLPSFQKNMLVWKLPLKSTPTARFAEDIIVKELNNAVTTA